MMGTGHVFYLKQFSPKINPSTKQKGMQRLDKVVQGECTPHLFEYIHTSKNRGNQIIIKLYRTETSSEGGHKKNKEDI